MLLPDLDASNINNFLKYVNMGFLIVGNQSNLKKSHKLIDFNDCMHFNYSFYTMGIEASEVCDIYKS